MNKQKALARLDAIEKEAEELRKIIDGKIEYDGSKIYVATGGGKEHCSAPYILCGTGSEYSFFSLSNTHSRLITTFSIVDCFAYCEERDFTIHEFDNRREALQFFLDHIEE